MREIIIHILYTISAFLDDLAFYVVGNQEEETGFAVETRWCKHYY